MDEIFWAGSLITPTIGIFKKKRLRDRRSRRPPPFTAATKKKFFIAFLAELGNLESFETMLFFSKIFPLTSRPVGGGIWRWMAEAVVPPPFFIQIFFTDLPQKVLSQYL